MRDLVLYAHIILGLLSIALSILILLNLRKKEGWLKPAAAATAAINWILIFPAGYLYTVFYPATKTLIQAGAWPWAHSIFMETKEHWGLLIPVIATVAAGLVWTNRSEESRRWWMLLIAVTVLIGIMGRIVKMGALA